MAFETLQDFVAALERAGQLRRIAEPVDPVLEITEIADRVVRAGGPALLFERPTGSAIPVLINAFGTMQRCALALGVADLGEIVARIERLLHAEPPGSFVEKIHALAHLSRLASFAPSRERSGLCQQVVIRDNPSLDLLPILKCWPQDGGRFLTLPMVFTKHPETGQRNVGMYRMHVYDSRTTGMHWHAHKVGAAHYRAWEALGKRMPVAVALGGDPALIYAATAPLPESVDEVFFAGFLRGASVTMAPCQTVDLEVPAGCEIVLEGYVEPGERRTEGPFGDHTGYYSAADDYPVFHLTCITHRRDPIYPATVVGPPPKEDAYLGKVTERLFLPMIRLLLPEIVDLNLPIEGIFHNLAIVSIRKRFPGHAHKVMHALWGMGQMMFTKIIVVLDEEANVQDVGDVIWRLGNHIDPQRDVCFVQGPADALDHAAPQPGYGSKMGIDATRKLPEEGHPRPWPDEITMTAEVKRRVDELWGRLGL
jgi:4-hydroxy-3-polyprenylbenzoate decarboxylase